MNVEAFPLGKIVSAFVEYLRITPSEWTNYIVIITDQYSACLAGSLLLYARRVYSPFRER